MKSTLFLCGINVLAVLFCHGQQEYRDIEIRTTTLTYFGTRVDTLIEVDKYDSNGRLDKEPLTMLELPISIDTNWVSDNTLEFINTWKDSSTTVTIHQQQRTQEEVAEIIIHGHESDTVLFSSFQLSPSGNVVSGLEIYHNDSTIYQLEKEVSLDDLQTVKWNTIRHADFMGWRGRITVKNRRHVLINDLSDARNEYEIWLNKHLQPQKIVQRQWHEYHQELFINKYRYKYNKSRDLIKLLNRDGYGDVEMLRRIEYFRAEK